MNAETDIQWFIARDGKQHGPVSDVELKKLVELGHLKSSDLVWRQGFPDWRKASSVFPAIAETPRPQAPAAAPSPAAPKAAAPSAPQQKSAPAAAPAPGPGAGPSLGQPPAAQQASRPAGPTTGRPAQPQHPSGPGPHGSAGPGASFGDTRPDQMGTRPLGSAPLGNALRGGPAQPAPGPRQPGPAPGPGLTAGPRPDQRIAPGPMPSPLHESAPPARRRKAPLVIAGLLVMGGFGAWLGSQYTEQIFAIAPTQTDETTETGTVTANLAPGEGKNASDANGEAPAPGASAPTFQEIDRTMQQRPIWASLKQEFPEWYQSRVAEVARLSGENKNEAEVTNHLVTELVKLRRENAKYALSASTPRHKDIAAAFLANLRELAREGGDGCYEFISRGEASSVIMARMQDPARSKQIEAQLVAIVAAISEGRKQPSEHARPVKTDYDLLAGELGRLGWTQADMQLFANPQELAKAPHERVCSMLQDWFAAHLAIQDASSQQRLLFETLKPVVSG